MPFSICQEHTYTQCLTMQLQGANHVTCTGSPGADRSIEEVAVLIVGAGPAGLATAACLGLLGVPYAVVERECCSASLWRRRAYDRLKLHLAKEFCELPFMAFPAAAPTYVPKEAFIRYLDDYAELFGIQPRYLTAVESSEYDEGSRRWAVSARNMAGAGAGAGEEIKYAARFLVVAAGENSVGSVPAIPGLEGFAGEAIHSSAYRSGRRYAGQSVLVVGAGNSGMEIAYDLASHGAKTSISIRSPVHIMSKELIRFGMTLVQRLPVRIVDTLLLMMANLTYGDLSRHGIVRPKMGPLLLKSKTGRSSIIDVGTVSLIKEGVIKVTKEVSKIKGNSVVFRDGEESSFDAIVFATGYKSTVNTWLKDGGGMFNKDGFPKNNFPNHWKGENGLYCAGFGRRGLAGIAMDAKNIAGDIMSAMDTKNIAGDIMSAMDQVLSAATG